MDTRRPAASTSSCGCPAGRLSRRRFPRTLCIPVVIARGRRWLTGDRDPSQSALGRVRRTMPDWPTTPEVAPSILSADFGRMREQVTEVLDAGARVIHIDVMDGRLLPGVPLRAQVGGGTVAVVP